MVRHHTLQGQQYWEWGNPGTPSSPLDLPTGWSNG